MITGADVIEDPMKRRTFLIKDATRIIKEKRGTKRMFKLRNELRKEGKSLLFYAPLINDLSDEIQLFYMLKE